MRGSRLAVAAALVVLAVSPSAHADGAPNAEAKFREGVSLLERRDYDAACARFEESFALEPAPGTLFNLGKCHGLRGELLRARDEFRDLAQRMDAASKRELADKARAAAADVEGKLARISFTKKPVKPIEVVVDGKSVPFGGGPVEIDPGPHRVEFREHGRSYAVRELKLESAQVVELEVPSPKSGDAIEHAPADTGQQASAWMKPAGYVVGGVGVVALGVGLVFGVRTLSLQSDALDACGGSKASCPSDAARNDAQQKDDDAHASATVSTIAIGAGLALVAGGVALVLLAPRAQSSGVAGPRAAKPRFIPWAAPIPSGGTAGATLSF